MSTSNTIGSRNASTSSRRRRLGEGVLTALRVVLAIQFAIGGVLKLAGSEPMVTLFADIGAGRWLRHVVGVLELAGAIGLLIPAVAGVAAAGLTALMAGALITRVAVLGGPPVLELLFLVAVAALAYHRRGQLRSLAARRLH
jgi:putative oxidoreductase